jgi:hypothetical protein
MDHPNISFTTSSPHLDRDPNRMDIAMFVGFLPLREGRDAALARGVIASQLAKAGWKTRVDATVDTLTDLPVRVQSIEQVEAIFDTGGRIDRGIRLSGVGLSEIISIDEDNQIFRINLDADELSITLPIGDMNRSDLVTHLAGISSEIDVLLGTEIAGRSSLIITRLTAGAGSMTVYANSALGFAVAQRGVSVVLGCPTGVALRNFFTAGGREAVIIPMGEPVPLFCTDAQRVDAITTLIGSDYGAGASSLVDLTTALPSLPPEFETRDPWHGLAHLHGLEDVTLIAIPDLPELLSTVSPIEGEFDEFARPKEIFQVCAAAPILPMNGKSLMGTPPRLDEHGRDLWAAIIGWAGREVAKITPEVMFIAPIPLLGDDVEFDTLADMGISHPQVQLVTPWIMTETASDMPASACPADGLLIGEIARKTLDSGAWRTVAGRKLPYVRGVYGAKRNTSHETTPAISVLGYGMQGVQILSDRSTDLGPYNQANLRRLIALVLRAARHRGQTGVFESNGPLFWRDVAMSMTTLLRQLHSAGALRGTREEEAFSVVCGRETMSQADIDAGRAIAEVTICPTHSLEKIEVLLTHNGQIVTDGGVAL